MKNILKPVIILLLPALCMAALSCTAPDGQTNSPTAENRSGGGDDVAVGEAAGEGLRSPVPDDLKFDGETVRFFNYYFEVDANGVADPAMATIMSAEEISGDIVYEAIYRRNMEVQAKLGVAFSFTHCPPDADPDQYQNSFINRLVKAGTDEFDLIIGRQFQCVRLTTEHTFRNIKELPYLDIDNPWWATRYINALTIGRDVLMYATGDISTTWLNRLSTMYFNRELYKNYLGDPDDLYRLVLDGKWTLDSFSGMVKDMYADLDGDGKPSDGDQYGLVTHTISQTDHFTYAAGIRATDRDENGFPYYVINSEITTRFVDKLYELYYNNIGTYIVPSSHSQFNNIFNDKFAANQALFRSDTLGTAGALRAMQTDFGMIPFPKLDESVPEYSSLVHDTAPLMCVPVTCEKSDELIGAVLEEMAFKGYMLMTPAFFDVALKNKYMRDSDDIAMRCLDIIRENSTTDFAYIYNYALKANPNTWDANVGLIMRDIMGGKSNNFASYWEKVEKPATENLQKIIDAYIK